MSNKLDWDVALIGYDPTQRASSMLGSRADQNRKWIAAAEKQTLSD